MKKLLSIFLALVLTLCLMPASVFADANGTKADFVTSVTVVPQRQRIQKGKSFTFTAEVLGSNTEVTWSISGQKSTATRIDSYTGNLTVDSNETADNITVRATSVIDSAKYDTAFAYPVDYPVYIDRVTINPSAITLPKGVSYRFTASVTGTDYDDVSWSLPCDHAEYTRIDSDGWLEIDRNEYMPTLTVRVSSVRNPAKYADAVVTVVDSVPIGSEVWVNYDTTQVGLSTSITGRQVTEALSQAVYRNDVADGTHVYFGTSWTCLVTDLSVNASGKVTCTKLGESDVLLDPSKTYYYLFNMENNSGYVWDTNNLPSATVNGQPADYVEWRAQSEDGDINIYKKASFSGSFVSSVTVTPYIQRIKKGNSFTFTAEVLGSVQTVNWTITGNHSSGTYINSSTGRVTVASDETANYITVKATSTFDSSKYDTAGVVPVDYDVYINRVTISPTSVTLPKGGSQTFTATVDGTDYDDVEWTVEGNNSQNTQVNSGVLDISNDETATSLTVKVTAVRDRSKYATASVIVTDQKTIPGEVWVNYDINAIGLTTTLTGRQVTAALTEAVYRNDVAEGTHIYFGTSWTCLVKDVQVDAAGKVTCTKLGDSDDLLNTTDEYYFVFNMENNSGYKWDTDNLPSAKVNGAPADYVCWRAQTEDGDINIYKRVYIDGESPWQVDVSPKTFTTTLETGYGSYAIYEPITFTNTGTEPLRLLSDDDSAIHCSNPLFNTLAGGMNLYLQPGESYTRDLVIEPDLGPGVYTNDVIFQDVEYKAEPAVCHVTVTIEGVVERVDIINMPDAYAGNLASNYNYSALSVNGEGYNISDLQWCTYDSEIGYLTFNGTFEMNHRYYLAVELETDDLWHFERTSTYGLAVYYYTRNGSYFDPIFYGSSSEYFNGNDWLKFYIPFDVTQESGVDVIPYPGSAFTEWTDYRVEGSTVIVNYAKPCKVGYWDGSKYVPIHSTENADGSHSFNCDGHSQVILVMTGDANLDGKITLSDSTTVKSYYNRAVTGLTLTPVQLFAGDANSDGQIKLADSTRIKAVYNNRVTGVTFDWY